MPTAVVARPKRIAHVVRQILNRVSRSLPGEMWTLGEDFVKQDIVSVRGGRCPVERYATARRKSQLRASVIPRSTTVSFLGLDDSSASLIVVG